MPEPPRNRRLSDRRAQRKDPDEIPFLQRKPKLPGLDNRHQNWVEGELQKSKKFINERNKAILIKMMKILEYFDKKDRPRLFKLFQYYQKHGKASDLFKIINDLSARGKNNSEILAELIDIAQRNAARMQESMLAKARDLAERDEITKLYITPKFKGLVQMYLREQPYGTFFFIDVNYLKTINDKISYIAGDAYLESLAESMSEIAQKYKFTIARIGGDEFGMYHTDNKRELTKEEVEQIKQELRDTFKTKWQALELSKVEASIAIGTVNKTETQKLTRKSEVEYKDIARIAADRMKYNKGQMKASR